MAELLNNSDMWTLLIFVVAALYAAWKGIEIKEKKANLSKVPEAVLNLDALASKYSKAYNVPKDLILATAWQENSGTMMPDGEAGEKGIMQLKPIAVKDVRLEKLGEFPNWDRDVQDNIGAGTAYLSLMIKRQPNMREAIRAYNQGGEGKDMNPDRSKKADVYFQNINEKRKFFS